MTRKTPKAGGEKKYTLRQRVEQFLADAGRVVARVHGVGAPGDGRANKSAGSVGMAPRGFMQAKRKK